MEGLSNRFEQSGGLYKKSEKSKLIAGGKPKSSPKNNNWKKKFLANKIELDNLKQENEILKSQIKKLKN